MLRASESIVLPVSVRLALADLKRALIAQYGIRFQGLVLYGSYARGTATHDSDVDVLILLSGSVDSMRESTQLSPLLGELSLHYNILLTAYPVPVHWLDERQAPLFENIRREGRRL